MNAGKEHLVQSQLTQRRLTAIRIVRASVLHAKKPNILSMSLDNPYGIQALSVQFRNTVQILTVDGARSLVMFFKLPLYND